MGGEERNEGREGEGVEVEGVGVDANDSGAAGDVFGREACELLVEGCDRGARDGVDDDDAETCDGVGWKVGG